MYRSLSVVVVFQAKVASPSRILAANPKKKVKMPREKRTEVTPAIEMPNLEHRDHAVDKSNHLEPTSSPPTLDQVADRTDSEVDEADVVQLDKVNSVPSPSSASAQNPEPTTVMAVGSGSSESRILDQDIFEQMEVDVVEQDEENDKLSSSSSSDEEDIASLSLNKSDIEDLEKRGLDDGLSTAAPDSSQSSGDILSASNDVFMGTVSRCHRHFYRG